MSTLAIVGIHGTMGSRVKAIALDQPWVSKIIGITLTPNKSDEYAKLEECHEKIDVIIDFSFPDQLEDTLSYASKHHIPCVIATTGLTSEHDILIKVASHFTSVFVSANLSMGVALLNELLKTSLNFIQGPVDIEVVETHHTLKKDAPSGTAKLLANTITQISGKTMVTSHPPTSFKDPNTFGVHALRLGHVVGDHHVSLAFNDEIITITHSALSKDIFAQGACQVASFVMKQPYGLYTMSDYIKEKV